MNVLNVVLVFTQLKKDCRLSPSGKLVHTYSNQWIISRLQNQPTADSAPYGFGWMPPPSPRATNISVKWRQQEHLTGKHAGAHC